MTLIKWQKWVEENGYPVLGIPPRDNSMNKQPPDLFDNFEIPEIDIATSPDEALEQFNNELRHSLASILGSVQILSMYPDEQLREWYLDVISLNVKRVESLRASVKTYLEKRRKSG
jgi:hypothetical protein